MSKEGQHRAAAAHRRRPVCEICCQEAGKPTEEHAYSAWLLRRTRETFRKGSPEFVPVRGWEQDAKVVLKPVCERCQRRLNSAFEIPARDILAQMLDGSVVELAPEQQHVVAAWFFKTAMVLMLARDKRSSSPVLTPSERSCVRTTLQTRVQDGEFPAHASVRIAQRSLDALPSGRPFVPLLPTDDPLVLTCAYAIETIMCEVVIDANSTTLKRHLTAGNYDARFIRLWPSSDRSVRWPPPIPVSYADIHTLTREWGHNPANERGLLRLVPRGKPDRGRS